MNANVAQLRANADKLRNDMRYENRKFLVQALVGAAALLGAGAALGNYFGSHNPAVPTIVVNMPPYSSPSAR